MIGLKCPCCGFVNYLEHQFCCECGLPIGEELRSRYPDEELYVEFDPDKWPEWVNVPKSMQSKS